MVDFPFQNNPQKLNPSYKPALNFWDCFNPNALRKAKIVYNLAFLSA